MLWWTKACAGISTASNCERAESPTCCCWRLCACVIVEAGMKLWYRSGEDFSAAGLAVAVAIPAMLWLAAAKRRLGAKPESGSLTADAAQGVACWYLAIIVIVGLLAQRLFGPWGRRRGVVGHRGVLVARSTRGVGRQACY